MSMLAFGKKIYSVWKLLCPLLALDAQSSKSIKISTILVRQQEKIILMSLPIFILLDVSEELGFFHECHLNIHPEDLA